MGNKHLHEFTLCVSLAYFITFVILVLMLQQMFIESKERQFFKTHSTSMTKFLLRRHFSDDRTIALVVDETVKLRKGLVDLFL